MTSDTRAARSDAAYAALNAEAGAVRALLDEGSAQKAGAELAALRARAAAASESLGAYDARKLGETLDGLSRAIAERSARPRFAFRARRRAPPSDRPACPAAASGPAPRTDPEPAQQEAHVRARADARLVVERAPCALRIAALKRCALRVRGVVDGSATVRGCRGCVLWIAARQVRIHDCVRCLFVLRAGSGPIIERCSDIAFAQWEDGADAADSAALGWEKVVLDAGADDGDAHAEIRENMWSDVQDFNWLQESQSPNWRVVESKKEVSAEKWISAAEDAG